MARRKRKIGVKRKTFKIIVDGETEKWYLDVLKSNERDKTRTISITPEIPKKKTLKGQYESVLSTLKEGYDQVAWIVDLDTILDESRKTPSGGKPATQAFLEYRQKLAKFSNVSIVVNNPCLEFWLLLHFKETAAKLNNCSQAETELKRYLPDYEKSQGYYKRKDGDIYSRLKPMLQTAIAHAQKLGNYDPENPQNAKSEMFTLFELLIIN